MGVAAPQPTQMEGVTLRGPHIPLPPLTTLGKSKLNLKLFCCYLFYSNRYDNVLYRVSSSVTKLKVITMETKALHGLSLFLLTVSEILGTGLKQMELNQRKTDNLLSQLHHFETMIPQLVDQKGEFLSYDVTHSSAVHHLTAHTTRSKRWAKQLNKKSLKSSNKTNFFLDGDKQKGRSSVFYKLSAYGKVFHLNLTLNTQLLSNDFAVEFINNTNRRKSLDELWDCHYTGVSVNGDASDAAISNCNGLHGVFSTESDDYFVEPLWNHTNVVGVDGHPHVVYSRSSLKYGDLSRYCGVTDYKRKKYVKWYRKRPGYLNDILKPRNQSPFWKWRPKRNDGNITSSSKLAKRRSRRSRSFESHIETLVVVDKKMLDYHVTSDTEDNRKTLTAYVLTIMNIVAKLFHNPTIGNAINIIVTRIFYLEAEKGDNLPQINYHADMSLDSFCKWQNNFTSNMGNNSDSGFNHDNAVLITRYDICTYKNDPCGTL
ncbi:A disintegrin and metalloproteinase with thrombospondin motifs 6, partial [Bulinus truncatus]